MNRNGFTLLETMITLGVAAVIALYAVSSYREHVARGHRLDAVSALYRAAQYVESGRTVAGGDAATALPAGFDQVPTNGTAIYTLKLRAESDTNGGYAIEAEPATPVDACGVFVLDATGLRSNRAAEKLTPPKVAACWSGK